MIFLETSAKTAENVKELFVEIADILPKHTQAAEKESFPVMPPNDARKEGCC